MDPADDAGGRGRIATMDPADDAGGRGRIATMDAAEDVGPTTRAAQRAGVRARRAPPTQGARRSDTR